MFPRLHQNYLRHKRFSKNKILPQNNLTPNVTLSEGLTMPCFNYIVMGYAINSILTPRRFTTYKVMNKFVTPESKRQHTSSSFVLQFNLNKLVALLSCALILATKPLWINLPWAMHSFTQGGLGQSFAKFVRCYHNWNFWPWIGLALLFWLMALCSLIFPCHFKALACLGPTYICCDPCSHCLGQLDFFGWPHF